MLRTCRGCSEARISRLEAAQMEMRRAGASAVFSPTTIREVVLNLKKANKWSVVDEKGLPWKPSHFGGVVLRSYSELPEMTASAAAGMKRNRNEPNGCPVTVRRSDRIYAGGRSTKGSAELQRGQTLLFSTLPDAGILKESADLQPWLSHHVENIDTNTFAVSWVDRHTTRSMGTRSPDNVHYQKGASECAETVVYIGDLKSQQDSGSSGFTDEEVAHMIDFLYALAAIQCWRHRFIGYLLNGASIVFFVLDFAESAVPGGSRTLVCF